jgi:hypothetical protein
VKTSIKNYFSKLAFLSILTVVLVKPTRDNLVFFHPLLHRFLRRGL